LIPLKGDLDQEEIKKGGGFGRLKKKRRDGRGGKRRKTGSLLASEAKRKE